VSTVTLSLISHTNVGKTTLARTLLRRDVGEVFDQAHVTEVSEAHELIAAGDDRLLLWDTPGLGDSARLVARLKKEGNPLGWLLHQMWDRTRDRALYSSQEAIRNIQSDADVVLYLVNASEDPGDAGYVVHELELLGWIGKPVIVILNQMGEATPSPLIDDDPIARWDEAMGAWPIVKHVLPLDAFTRCWVQEGLLLEKVADVLPESGRPVMQRLLTEWQRRGRETFEQSVHRIAQYLAGAAADHERLAEEQAGRGEKRRAMRALAMRLDQSTGDLMAALLDLHGLSGRFQEEARARLEEDFRMPGEIVSSGRAAIWGAAMGGAAGGIVTDIVTGGLSFGAGAIAGAVLGAMGAAGLLKGYQMALGADLPTVRWSQDFLRDLVQSSALRYLAVAHFGRGRGEWRELGNAARWTQLVERTLAARADRLQSCVWAARDDSGFVTDADARFADLVRVLLREVLCTVYPQAVHILPTRPR
jgi:GTPase Era involved in 16S rRNA processing